MRVSQIFRLPQSIDTLINESEAEGFRFLRRLFDDFNSGKNQFNQVGEALFVIENKGLLLAIGGVNRTNSTTGRIRRFYVAKQFRGLGIGGQLLDAIETHTAKHFTTIELYTDTPDASSFYRRHHYQPVKQPKVSHFKRL